MPKSRSALVVLTGLALIGGLSACDPVKADQTYTSVGKLKIAVDPHGPGSVDDAVAYFELKADLRDAKGTVIPGGSFSQSCWYVNVSDRVCDVLVNTGSKVYAFHGIQSPDAKTQLATFPSVTTKGASVTAIAVRGPANWAAFPNYSSKVTIKAP